jgi:small-conductance mechanosensitive channel
MRVIEKFFYTFHISENFLVRLLKVGLVLLIGLILAKILKNFVQRLSFKNKDDARQTFLPDLMFYLSLTVSFFVALDILNVDIKLLLGTAGFLTVALGFASQTSVSNIISGLFMMTERPFTIGDLVQIGDITGVILSIDLLSTRLRTVDNLLVRMPNESLMKANIINYTRFPVRRVDILFKIELQQNIKQVREIAFELAQHNPQIFDEPRPLFIIKEIQDWAILIQFSFWVEKDQHLEQKNDFIEQLLDSLKKENISLPTPKREVFNITK